MKIVYFISSNFPYGTVIYPGIGPRLAQPFGWPTVPISSLSHTACDAGIIDGRLTDDDCRQLDAFLAAPQKMTFPIFFHISDPETPVCKRSTWTYSLGRNDLPGVHYLSVYDPEGPLLDFVKSLKRSRVVYLPYPYDVSRQVERDFAGRKQRIFLSGAMRRRLYPLRYGLHSKRQRNPLARLVVSELRHPGYPDIGQGQRHSILHERYIEHAAGFTHFFLCPSRYRIELMKYVECAYAGCVPIGELPNSLKDQIGHCLLPYTGKTMELLNAVLAGEKEMVERAAEYRRIMRSLRDPAKLAGALEEQIRAML